ncbi:hypothetical protein LDL76_09650 [Salegentibacter mishustinae]|uniref:hypothetical protein n=1 Tax=Salegentibacter mishustinae TaxID=270918 RepID=UPI001CE07F17|nr:hypothetical protein [Salegentibacter mishustinae]UBZ05635.1 hypothetical protein LDL76_09650 [Salegentibacter mishustinae]
MEHFFPLHHSGSEIIEYSGFGHSKTCRMTFERFARERAERFIQPGKGTAGTIPWQRASLKA